MTDKQPKIEEQMNNDTIEKNTLPNVPKALQVDCKDDLDYHKSDVKLEEKETFEERNATKEIIKTLEKFKTKKIWSPQLQELYNDLKEDNNTEKYQSIQELEEILLILFQLEAKFSQANMIAETFTEKKTKNSIHQTSMGNSLGRSEIDGKNNDLKIESNSSTHQIKPILKSKQNNQKNSTPKEKVSSKDDNDNWRLMNNQSSRGVPKTIPQHNNKPLNKSDEKKSINRQNLEITQPTLKKHKSREPLVQINNISKNENKDCNNESLRGSKNHQSHLQNYLQPVNDLSGRTTFPDGDQINLSKNEIDNLNMYKVSLRKENVSLRKENVSLRKENESLREKIKKQLEKSRKEIENQKEKIKTLEQKMDEHSQIISELQQEIKDKDLISILTEVCQFISDRDDKKKPPLSHIPLLRVLVDKISSIKANGLQKFFAEVEEDKRCESYLNYTNNHFSNEGWLLDLLCCLRNILSHKGPKSPIHSAILQNKEKLKQLIHILFLVVPDLQKYITQVCTEEAYLTQEILDLQLPNKLKKKIKNLQKIASKNY